VSGAIYPEFDFAGRKLQDLASPERLESLTYSALPLQARASLHLYGMQRGKLPVFSSCGALIRLPIQMSRTRWCA
jgi:hypothetical protein